MNATLHSGGECKRNPAVPLFRIGFEQPPSVLFLDHGENACAGKFARLREICSGATANIQIGDCHAHHVGSGNGEALHELHFPFAGDSFQDGEYLLPVLFSCRPAFPLRVLLLSEPLRIGSAAPFHIAETRVYKCVPQLIRGGVGFEVLNLRPDAKLR